MINSPNFSTEIRLNSSLYPAGTRLPVFFNHLPAGTSLPNIAHFGQGIRSKQMTLLDYLDAQQNLECYNSVRPPRVPLENITESDLFLFNSLNDLMGDPKDVKKLKAALKGRRPPCLPLVNELNLFSHQ